MFKRVMLAAAVVTLGASPLMACLVDGKFVPCDSPFIGCHAKASTWTGGDLERPVPYEVLAAEEPAPETVIVYTYNFDYSANPEGLGVVDPVITPGTTVRWIWDRGVHDVTAYADTAEDFHSESTFGPYAFEYTFNNPGVFNYYCTIHVDQNMAGVITVVPEPGMIGAAGAALLLLKRRRSR